MGRHHQDRAKGGELPQLYRSPLVFDPLFVVTGSVAVLTFSAIMNSDEPDPDIPVVLDALLAAVVFSLFFGVFPAFIRLALHQRRLLTHLTDPSRNRGFPESLHIRTRQRAPYPVASPVRIATSTSTREDEYRAILAAAQSAAVCVSVYLLGVARREDLRIDAADPVVRLLRSALTEAETPFDSWLSACQPLIDHIWAGSDTHLGTALGRLSLEHRRATDAGQTMPETVSLVPLRQALDQLLRAATLLHDTDWLLVDTVSAVSTGDIQVTGALAMADHPDFERITVSMPCDTEAIPGGVTATGPGDDWLALDPLVTHRRHGDWDHRAMYYFDHLRVDGAVVYRAFRGDTSIVVPDRAHEIRELARQVFGP